MAGRAFYGAAAVQLFRTFDQQPASQPLIELSVLPTLALFAAGALDDHYGANHFSTCLALILPCVCVVLARWRTSLKDSRGTLCFTSKHVIAAALSHLVSCVLAPAAGISALLAILLLNTDMLGGKPQKPTASSKRRSQPASLSPGRPQTAIELVLKVASRSLYILSFLHAVLGLDAEAPGHTVHWLSLGHATLEDARRFVCNAASVTTFCLLCALPIYLDHFQQNESAPTDPAPSPVLRSSFDEAGRGVYLRDSAARDEQQQPPVTPPEQALRALRANNAALAAKCESQTRTIAWLQQQWAATTSLTSLTVDGPGGDVISQPESDTAPPTRTRSGRDGDDRPHSRLFQRSLSERPRQAEAHEAGCKPEPLHTRSGSLVRLSEELLAVHTETIDLLAEAVAEAQEGSGKAVSNPPMLPSDAAESTVPVSTSSAPGGEGDADSDVPGEPGLAAAEGSEGGVEEARAASVASWVDPFVQQSLMTMRTSASALAHDMRNPLTLLVAMSDMLVKRNGSLEEARKELVVMKTCSNHLLMMINAMCDNLWLLSGKLNYKGGWIYVRPAVDTVLQNLNGIKPDKVDVAVDVDKAWQCFIDDERFKHIMHILLANAFKYTRKGTVKVSASEEGQSLLIVVSDSGSGVDAKTLTAFSHPTSDRRHPSVDPHSVMRVGLRFAARLAAVGGASLSVRKGDGAGRTPGTVVTLCLPRATVEQRFSPTIMLPGGESSLDDHTADDVRALFEPLLRATAAGKNVAGVKPPLVQPLAVLASSSEVELADQSAQHSGSSLSTQLSSVPPSSAAQESTAASTEARETQMANAREQAAGQQRKVEQLVEASTRTLLGPSTDEERTRALEQAMQSRAAPSSPRHVTRSQAMPAASGQENGRSSQRKGDRESRHLIMVVDDDPSNLYLLESLLQQQGYDTLTADCGMNALEVFAQCTPKPRCVLLDVTLPDISGHEVCAKFAQMTPGLSVPVIMVSGKNETADVIRGLRKGAVDYITKPFIADEVLARIDRILEFHLADSQQAKAPAKQYQEFLRLLFPSYVAALIQNGHQLVLDDLKCVCVVSLAITGFTELASTTPMPTVVQRLNHLVESFDRICAEYGLEKLDVTSTTYSAFLIVGSDQDKASAGQAAVKAAQAILTSAEDEATWSSQYLQVQAGVHCGPAVATVIGPRRPKYVMVGAAVDVASGLRTAAIPGTMLMSPDIVRAIENASGEGNSDIFIICPPLNLPSLTCFRPFTTATGNYERLLSGSYGGVPAESVRSTTAVLHSVAAPHLAPLLADIGGHVARIEVPVPGAGGGGAKDSCQTQHSQRFSTGDTWPFAGTNETNWTSSDQQETPASAVSGHSAGAPPASSQLPGGYQLYTQAWPGQSRAMPVPALRAQVRELVPVSSGASPPADAPKQALLPSSSTNAELLTLLQRKGLAHYAVVLSKCDVTPAQLRSMSDEQLLQLGVLTKTARNLLRAP